MKNSAKYNRNRWFTFLSTLILIAFINLTLGCHNFYKVTSYNSINDENYKSVNKEQKYFILHQNDDAWHITDLTIEDNIAMKAKLNQLPIEHEKYKNTHPTKPNRYKSRTPYKEQYVINEVHIYTSNMVLEQDSIVNVPLQFIQKIEMYDQDIGATSGSWLLGFFGYTILVAVILAVIVAATKSSCPFIYTYDGSKYNFEGEIYSGAINAPMERHDYLKLSQLIENDNEYKIKMTNEVLEIQSTNLLELLVVDHPKNSEVLYDKYGTLHSFSDQQAPIKATDLYNNNTLDKIIKKDSLQYLGNITDKPEKHKDGLILHFDKTENSDNCKLIIKAKNSYWLDYVYGQFLDLFGNKYQAWNKHQNHASKEEMQQWSMSQGIPLSVYIDNNGTWEFVDYFNIVGPLALKNDVLSLNVKNIESSPIKIKLEWGHMFWELDYVAIDYSPTQTFLIKSIPPQSAIDQDGNNVIIPLLHNDNNYQILKEVGDKVDITFKTPHKPADANRSYFLHSKGYYEIIRDAKGKPDKKYLKSFAEPTQFNKFSKEQMDIIMKQLSN